MIGTPFQIVTPLKDAEYRDYVRGMNKAAWPEFMLHEQVANELWHELLERFPAYQIAIYDTEQKRAAAMGNSLPLRWDGTMEDLPEGGWDWAFEQAVHDHKNGVPPNLHCAIQVIVHPEYRKHGLSLPMLKAVHGITISKGLQALIIPVRPSEKSKYPLASLDDYVTWKTEEGLPFDAWLRVHVRAGGKFIKVCHQSKTVRGSQRDWEQWTGLKFPQSGSYILPNALQPVELDIEKGEGLYIEPNLWMVHEVH
jgi:GNAT superfamily N-acetyltransferase